MSPALFLVLLFCATACLASRVHMIGLFHTETTAKYSHCAFTGKVLRFAPMMQALGYHIIEYGNGQTESGASEFVQVLSSDELKALLPERHSSEFYAKTAVLGSPAHAEFSRRLLPLMRQRVQQGDIICHPFGKTHQDLASEVPQALHVECGIGYPEPWSQYRIFESRAKLHYQLGLDRSPGRQYDFVVPNYFNESEWPADESSPLPNAPLVYMGRITSEKGMQVIAELARLLPQQRFHVAGQGQFSAFFSELSNVHYFGSLVGAERSLFFRGAVAALMPTLYVEPFGGAGVEAQLSGTPLLASHFGAFSETIEHGRTGFLCRTIGDWLQAIQQARSLNHTYVAQRARSLYSLEAVGRQYDVAFRVIKQLYTGGWNNVTSLQSDSVLFT